MNDYEYWQNQLNNLMKLIDIQGIYDNNNYKAEDKIFQHLDQLVVVNKQREHVYNW